MYTHSVFTFEEPYDATNLGAECGENSVTEGLCGDKMSSCS